MKTAIMQPYFFPYLGYLSLLYYADVFIIFDTPQYNRKGWMHRNRILKPEKGWQYIRAGIIKPAFRASINTVRMKPDKEWCHLILRQLEHYKYSAPYYHNVCDMLSSLFSSGYETLVEFNKRSLEAVQKRLNIQCEIKTLSELDIKIDGIKAPGHWALRISEAVSAKEYVNPINGRDLFSKKEFSQKKITLSFLNHLLPEYSQGNRRFEPGLSVIDVMMFNSTERIKEMLGQFEIL